MDFVFQYQIMLFCAALILGIFCSLALLLFASESKIWKIADLVWIVVGGSSAFSALAASAFLSQMGSIQREIDIAYSDLNAAKRASERFETNWCKKPKAGFSLQHVSASENSLCTDVRLLTVLTNNQDSLYAFVETFERANDEAPMGRKSLGGNDGTSDLGGSGTLDWSLATGKLVPPPSDEIEISRSILISTGFHGQMISEYDYTKTLFEEVENQFIVLQEIWSEIVLKRFYLFIRILSLFALALVFPLRIGKSIFELR